MCLLGQACVAVISSAPLMFLRDMPPTPPGPTPLAEVSQRHQSRLVQSVETALFRRPFRHIMIAFGATCGAGCALYAIADDSTRLTMTIAGVAGCAFFGMREAGSRTLLHTSRMLAVVSLASVTLLLFIMLTTHLSQRVLLPVAALVAFFATPVMPIAMEIGAEVLFPLSESVTGALLWLAGSVGALPPVFIIVNSWRLDDLIPVMFLVWFLYALSLYALVRFNGGFRRRQFELGRNTADALRRAASSRSLFSAEPNNGLRNTSMVPPGSGSR
eukprot:NODE_8182_length_1516_cov_5.290137.p1 GENE.NODE_8182_length_1516_cov_5.290137~~NODE_8182_length_1516_cov_5.290137.p1  ORF type:complete len:273 (-),score=67.71 NODE_8182_length_1516_cov_5.290137:68-886(-)